MDILTQERNFVPVDIETRFHACKRAKESHWKISKVCSFYHVRKSSLFRWLKAYDGTSGSLKDHSHRPKTPHPKTLSEEVIKKVLDLKRRNPDNSYMEIWIKMHRNNYVISLSSTLRILKRNKEYSPYLSNAKKKHDKPYHTPTMIGEKWQIDVKFVPKECYTGGHSENKFYQYTILDECSRKRYLHYTNEHSLYETVTALKKAIRSFGYSPIILQSDNGLEFTDKVKRTNTIHSRKYQNYLEQYCIEKGIIHKLIRPRTPEHNGKVERSHRIDQDKFYRTLRFFNLEDLRNQGESWNRRYNDTPRFVLKCLTPNEIELSLYDELIKIRAKQGQKSLTSFES